MTDYNKNFDELVEKQKREIEKTLKELKESAGKVNTEPTYSPTVAKVNTQSAHSPTLFPVSESYPNPLFKKDVAEVDLNFLNENYTSKSANSSASSIKQYKVMTQKDKWYSPNFDPERLEQALNAYAKEGWVVKSICSVKVAGFGGNREELIVVFER